MIRKPGIVAKVFSIFCVAWTCAVPLYYVVTLDDKSIVQLTRSILDSGERFVPGFPFLFLLIQFFAVPYGIFVALCVVWGRIGSPAWRGTLAGLSYGLWANTVFLAVP